MQRLARIVTVLTALLALAVGGGFVAFVAAAHRDPAPPPATDGIVVFTGGADRVETGLRLLAEGRAKLLLVSGVAHGAGLNGLLHRAGLEEGPIDARITLGRTATSTLGNAEETAEWVAAYRIQSLIVVTAGFHMPRAMLELRRALPAVALYPLPVQPPSAGRLNSARVLAAEYVKLLGAWAGLSRVTKQPAPAPLRHPVDKSVNG